MFIYLQNKQKTTQCTYNYNKIIIIISISIIIRASFTHIVRILQRALVASEFGVNLRQDGVRLALARLACRARVGVVDKPSGAALVDAQRLSDGNGSCCESRYSLTWTRTAIIASRYYDAVLENDLTVFGHFCWVKFNADLSMFDGC